jgi:hypothetical protein
MSLSCLLLKTYFIENVLSLPLFYKERYTYGTISVTFLLIAIELRQLSNFTELGTMFKY